jgi:acyl-CoA dehydrogenase
VSYGAYADAYLTTLRRSPDADASDQVLVYTRREETTLEPLGDWDTLGMRGTCSPGFVVRGEATAEAVLQEAFGTILVESMAPFSWILWSNVWLGIATDACDRARRFARASARRSPDSAAPIAQRTAQLLARLNPLRADVRAAAQEFATLDGSPEREQLHAMTTSLRFNALKVSSSEGAVDVCERALGVTGIAGFRNGGPYSVGRHIRDTLSAPLMVANERLNALNGTMLTVVKEI